MQFLRFLSSISLTLHNLNIKVHRVPLTFSVIQLFSIRLILEYLELIFPLIFPIINILTEIFRDRKINFQKCTKSLFFLFPNLQL